MIDAEDRRALGIATVWIGMFVLAALTIAVSAGLAVRVFVEVAGI